MNDTLESVRSAVGTPTAKTPRSSSKAKQTNTHAGFRYEVGNPRKNGSEVWKCIDRDCKASVIKKGDDFSLTKEHTLAGATMQTTLQHVTMTLMRDRALKFPAETPSQIIHNVTTSVRDLVLATAPPATTLERVIAEWRQEAQGAKTKKKSTGSSTPKNKNKTGGSSRKRLKMTPKGKNQVPDSEEDEAELDELEKLEDGGDDEEEEEEDPEEDEEEEEQIVPKKRRRKSGSDDDFA